MEAVGTQLTDAGVTYKFIGVTPEDSPDKLKAELTASPLDAVIFGFGIRGNPELTVWFEQMLNSVIELAPKAKVLFNSSPPTTMDAVRRWFPIKGSA